MAAKRLTDEELAERRERDRQLAQKAVEDLRSSEGSTNWLKVRSRTALARYSLLISMTGVIDPV